MKNETDKSTIVINFKNSLTVSIGTLMRLEEDEDEKENKRVTLWVGQRKDLTIPKKQFEGFFRTKAQIDYEKNRDLECPVQYYKKLGEIHKSSWGDFAKDVNVWFVWDSKQSSKIIESIPPLKILRDQTLEIAQLKESLKIRSQREEEMLIKMSELVNEDYDGVKKQLLQSEIFTILEKTKALEKKDKPPEDDKEKE